MKKLILLAIALAISIAIYFFWINPPQQSDSNEVVQLTDLPWQIEVDGSGNSTVFGQTLGVSTLGDFQKKVGTDATIKLFRNPDSSLSLEAFFKKIILARITSKVAFKLQASDDKLVELESLGVSKKVTPTGNHEIELPRAEEANLLDAKIAVITWSPTWLRLDDEMITTRFGSPHEIIDTEESVQHWLYPDKGLDIIRKPRNKVTLHYISPNQFAKVREELKAQEKAKAGD